ncbi:MAG: serine protein kinase RIO [Myxococcales bacterium]|nr:MAG: serine protein kinase RIO [Myxococcales bacterium]
MQIPDALTPLFNDGILEQVLRPLRSGKEAEVFLVMARGELCVAKIYKDLDERSFKNRGDYQEGRRTRNTRDRRAVDKGTTHGREREEAAWKEAEHAMLCRLQAAGVRVPAPHAFSDGVLVMECVLGLDGAPAPRLGERGFDAAGAQLMFDRLLREVVRMLALGVVHGDLSDFNVLVSGDDPVLIDFPQSVDAVENPHARKLLLRDVDNLYRFLRKYVPDAPRLPHAEEMWDLHEKHALTADTPLTGGWRPAERVDTGEPDSEHPFEAESIVVADTPSGKARSRRR